MSECTIPVLTRKILSIFYTENNSIELPFIRLWNQKADIFAIMVLDCYPETYYVFLHYYYILKYELIYKYRYILKEIYHII